MFKGFVIKASCGSTGKVRFVTLMEIEDIVSMTPVLAINAFNTIITEPVKASTDFRYLRNICFEEAGRLVSDNTNELVKFELVALFAETDETIVKMKTLAWFTARVRTYPLPENPSVVKIVEEVGFAELTKSVKQTIDSLKEELPQ